MSSFRPSAQRACRRAALGASALVAAAAFAPAAQAAGPNDVQLTSVFAKPIVAAPYDTDVKNGRSYCNPEPDGQLIYGTQAPFDPSRSIRVTGLGAGYPGSTNPNYAPANVPSRDDLVPALDAGASNDLCFGFTLTPNVQPDFILNGSNPDGKRLQSDPATPDVPGTHVETTDTKDAEGNVVTRVAKHNDDLKNVSIDLPVGFLGDPDGQATCSDADFGLGRYKAETCDPASQAGTVFTRVSALLQLDPAIAPLKLFLASGGAPNNINSLANGGKVYTLEHGPNELGRLGVSIQPASGLPPAKFVVRLQLAPDGTGRIRTVVQDAPRALYEEKDVNEDGTLKPGATELPIYLETVGIRAWGTKAAHPTLKKDFAEWGTDCSKPIGAKVSAETYLGATSAMDSAPITLKGCESLPFLPSVDVTTSERRPAVPTAATVTVGLGQTTTGPKSALLRDAAVTLPTGLELGAQVASGAGGLPLCTAAQFGFDQQGAPSSCPAAAKAGELTIVTPLLSRPFRGAVYLGEQPAVGELPALYLEAAPEGATAADAPRVKIKGSVSVDADGRITTTFKDSPQLRFSQLRLDFAGGENALFTTPRQCGVATGSSTFRSWATDTPVTVPSSIDINEDCATPGFAPSFAMAAADPTAGVSSPTTVTLAREDRSPWLKDFKVSLPSGFLADLNVVSECPAGQAAVGACPESSRMGTVTTTAGVGPKPLTLGGQMYMTERQSGAVAGAVIVVRAKIGEIDLGDVIVPARIDLRPTDAGLVLTASAPTRFKGLALNLRTFSVNLDRPGFPLNPTACGPLPATAELTGDGGQPAAPTTTVNYVNCGARPLAPKLTPSLSGEVKERGHPEVKVSMETRRGDTNLKSAVVMLPDGVVSDPKNLQNLCQQAQFDAAGCPAATRVGSVSANVSITSETINGDIFLVKVPGEALPGLGLNFTGRYTQRVLSKVRTDRATARLITAFEAIPDLPLTRLDIKIDGGAKSPIILNSKLCEKPSSWDATFGGQGGQKATAKIPTDCSIPEPTVKWSRKTGIKLTFTAPAKTSVKSYKLTMPSGFKLKTSKSSVKKYVKVSASGGKVKTKVSKSSLSIVARGAGPKKITITLKPKGYTVPKTKAYKKGLKKGKTLKLKLRGVTSDGKIASLTKSVKTS